MLFAKEWVPHDPMSRGGDGLGPVYNESSCVACHGLGAPGGAGPESKNVVLVTASSNRRDLDKGLERIHPGLRNSRSAVLHRYGTDPEYGTWRRRFYESPPDEPPNPPPARTGEDSIAARIRAVHEQTARDRRGRSRVAILSRRNGVTLTLSERNTPVLFGAGRIDAIPTEALFAVARSQPTEVRGRVGRTADGRVARFGWKAEIATLLEFVRGACATELGLEVPGHSQSVSPLAPSEQAKGLDMTEADCDDLVAYIRALPAPVAVNPDGPQGTPEMREGRRLFADLGCADCHTPTLGNVRGIYSDLLLHNMGPSLSDAASSYGIEGPASPGGPGPREWRTPPLWGYRDSGPYLHDGRAEDLEEAVALHGGQAQASARRFFALAAQDRFRVEAFLKSLAAPSATATTGVVLASEMESRFEWEEERTPESLVRRRWEEAMARGDRQRREEEQRRRAEEAVHRARVRYPIARTLEKKGKFKGALEIYSAIAREAPDTEEGHQAAARVTAIRATADHREGLPP
jgi:mono/diheme cytochrome c family protein